MQSNLAVDSFCEFADILKPWTAANFWDVNDHEFVPGMVYLIERQRFVENGPRLREHIERGESRFVFSLPFEGSETLVNHLYQYRLADLVRSKKLLLISGGDMSPEWPHVSYDMFATKFHDFEENIAEAETSSRFIFEKTDKPYKFLFLNGRERPQRKYLLERFRMSGLLNQSIWSNLSPISTPCKDISLWHNGVDLVSAPGTIKFLNPEYEVPRYRDRSTQIVPQSRFVKSELFDNEWGDIYVNAAPYVDTYFSLVTETVFNYPYSFRTEKIWKPIAMAHPWIAVANQGYYRDIQNLGFQTFGHLIDESFDDIENNQQRIERIAEVVEDLCQQDLQTFLEAAQEICKYNQQHLLEYRDRVRREFPQKFFQFLEKYE